MATLDMASYLNVGLALSSIQRVANEEVMQGGIDSGSTDYISRGHWENPAVHIHRPMAIDKSTLICNLHWSI